MRWVCPPRQRSTVIINTSLTDAAKVMLNYQSWSRTITKDWTFEKAFKKEQDKPDPQACHRFSIPNMVGNIPEYVSCTECSLTMKVTVTFECCHGKH